MVLLNVAMMCTTPSDSTTFLLFLAAFLGAPSPAASPAAASGAVAGVSDTGLGFGCSWSAMGYFLRIAFFLPAMVRRGPFLVRALVRVRWPRTGSPRRWRMPR